MARAGIGSQGGGKAGRGGNPGAKKAGQGSTNKPAPRRQDRPVGGKAGTAAPAKNKSKRPVQAGGRPNAAKKPIDRRGEAGSRPGSYGSRVERERQEQAAARPAQRSAPKMRKKETDPAKLKKEAVSKEAYAKLLNDMRGQIGASNAQAAMQSRAGMRGAGQGGGPNFGQQKAGRGGAPRPGGGARSIGRPSTSIRPPLPGYNLPSL